MDLIFDILDPLCDVIVMCANAVADSNQVGKRFTMQQIRSALIQCCKERSYDFIDNYALFANVDPSIYLADGLHPNAVGHYMMYRNMVDNLQI